MRAAALESVNLLELAPRRVASWSEKDGRVVIERTAPESPWRTPFLWLSYKMATKRVRLDEVGSFAWRRFDGRRTVAELADELRSEFGDQVEPAEERLGEMVRLLHAGGVIAYAGWEDGGAPTGSAPR